MRTSGLRKSRRRPFNIALVSGPDPRVVFDEEQWKRIGGNYCELTAADRDHIANLVSLYLLFQKGERSVEFVDDALPYIENIQKGAERLFKAMQREEVPGEASRHFSYAQQIAVTEVTRSFARYLGYHFRHPVELSSDGAVSVAGFLVAACEDAKNRLKAGTQRGLEAHTSWGNLMWRLMDWAEGREGPLKVTVAKKTTSAKHWPSPFVAFVFRLSAELPADNREFVSSEEALTSALDDVRNARREKRGLATQ